MTPTTARDLIKSAYRLAGVLAVGQTMSGDREAIGLEALNQLIDSWNADGLSVFAVTTTIIPTQAGVASYTIGPSGSVVTTRPISILSAMYRDTNATPPVDTIVTELSVEDFAQLAVKDIENTQAFFFCYNPTFPNGTITLFPVPSTPQQFIIQHGTLLDSNLNANSVITLPPAYARALRFNLAVALGIESGRAQVNPAIVQVAQQSKTLLERNNIRVPTLAYDLGTADYDIETDFWR